MRKNDLAQESVGVLATIRDIAKIAHVSAATVSNVLNGKPGAASPEKTQAILEAVKQLNYHPNYMARNLKSKRSHTIGIITEDLTVQQTPKIVNGIEQLCESCGYETLLADMRLYQRFGNDYDNNLDAQASIFDSLLLSLNSKQVEGIIYIGYHCRIVANHPSDTHFPFVYAYCLPQQSAHPAVLFDEEQAGYDVGTALLAQGHRRIGLITGPVNSLNSRARLRGFQKALFRHDVPYNVDATVTGNWTRDSGYNAMETLLQQDVTAIFAFSDEMAGGAFTYCMHHNIAVGKDLSIFGYDNSIIARAYLPEISTVSPPLKEMGRQAAQLVISAISGESLPSQPTLIPCKVILRGSLGAVAP